MLPAYLASVVALQFVLASGPPAGDNSLSSATPVVVRDLWAQFFRSGDREATAVSADSGFALWQDVTGKNIELGDYITRRFVRENDDPRLREVASRLFTSPADLNVALELAEVSRLFRGHVKQRHARDITAGELRSGNFILLGSRRSNPWVGLFESRMNFVLVIDGKTGAPHFRNNAPKPGEPLDASILSRFDSDGAEQRQMISYAVAALVPSLSGNGLTLILEGLNMEATAAVGDVVTSPDKLTILLRKLGHKPGTPVRPFEALVKLTSIPGGFAYPEVIAVRHPGR